MFLAPLTVQGTQDHPGLVDLQACTQTYDSFYSGLLDLPLGAQQQLGLEGFPAADRLGGGGGISAVSALGALSAGGGLSQETFQQLVALQQQQQKQQKQQQLAQTLAADPLMSLSNLLAAQQGLSARVQELLLLKQQLQAVVPQRPGGGSGIRGTGPLANPLYKTELCRSWEETGNCRYGAKCQFAHGGEELRPVVRHPKYKTEVCRTFAQNGTCPYGTRCRFIHTTSPTSPTTGGGPGCARGGSATPSNGASTPPPRMASRDASYSSLAGLSASTPTTPPLASYAPGSGSPAAFPPAPPATISPGLASLPGFGLGGGVGGGMGGLGGPMGADAATIASLLSLQAGSGGNSYACNQGIMLPASPFSTNRQAASTAASYGYVPTATHSGQAAAWGAAAGAYQEATLAALAALLNGTGASAPMPVHTPASPLTTAAAALGVVGPPAALPHIGTAAAHLAAEGPLSGPGQQQHFPSCPSTPVGVPGDSAGHIMRRSISDQSDPSTPGGSLKRLPIFERLIPEAGGRCSYDLADGGEPERRSRCSQDSFAACL